MFIRKTTLFSQKRKNFTKKSEKNALHHKGSFQPFRNIFVNNSLYFYYQIDIILFIKKQVGIKWLIAIKFA